MAYEGFPQTKHGYPQNIKFGLRIQCQLPFSRWYFSAKNFNVPRYAHYNSRQKKNYSEKCRLGFILSFLIAGWTGLVYTIFCVHSISVFYYTIFFKSQYLGPEAKYQKSYRQKLRYGTLALLFNYSLRYFGLKNAFKKLYRSCMKTQFVYNFLLAFF